MADYDPDKHCGAQRANQPPGTHCTRQKGWGTDHPGIGRCKRHGGSTRNHNTSASKEIARRECLTLGVPIEIHPADALVEEVFRARGNVDFYERLVQELPTHPEDDEFIPPQSEDAPGYWKRGDPGVYGRTYHVSGVPTGEGKPHVLVVLYNQERERLAAVASAALKAGVDAKRLELAQQDAATIAEFGRALVLALGHDPAAPEVREAFRAQLQLIAGGRAA